MCPAKSKEGVNKVSGFLNENMVFKTRVLRKGYTIVLQEAKIEKEKKNTTPSVLKTNVILTKQNCFK